MTKMNLRSAYAGENQAHIRYATHSEVAEKVHATNHYRNRLSKGGAWRASLYKTTITLAQKEGDITTKKLFEKTLEDEEEHHDTFASLLEEI